MKTGPPFDTHKTGFVALIQELNRQSCSDGLVTLGDAVDQAGVRMHGAAILLMALPECLPLPIPSLGAILGVPLIAVSAHLVLYGEQGDLPAHARKIAIPFRMIQIMSRYLIGPLRFVERISQQRLEKLVSFERFIGTLCLLMSLLLLLPIPLMNAPPAIALVCLSWGLVQRDGLFVSVGIVISIAIVLSLFAIAERIASLLS